MSHERRREMVDREHPVMSTVRQCNLLDISRSSLYYRHTGNSSEGPAVMKAIDHQYLVTPFYRVAAHDGLAQEAGLFTDPEVGPALNADHGTCSDLPASADHKPAPGHNVQP